MIGDWLPGSSQFVFFTDDLAFRWLLAMGYGLLAILPRRPDAGNAACGLVLQGGEARLDRRV